MLHVIYGAIAKEASLHALFGTGVTEGLSDHKLFGCRRVGREALETMTQEILNSKRSLENRTEVPSPGSAQDRAAETAFERIRQNLSWAYAYGDVTRMPAKLSVSELTHRDDEFSAVRAGGTFRKSPAWHTPAGTAAGRPDALALGSACHAIIEHLDLTAPVDERTVQATIGRLTKSGQLPQSLARTVDIAAITSFFDGPLGRMAHQAGERVLREWPFTYGLDSSALGADTADETVILQGIIDMIIPTDAGLVIVDFKTDRVTGDTIDERAQRYAAQLRHYACAAAAILKQPVAAAWLYFLMPSTAVEVKLS